MRRWGSVGVLLAGRDDLYILGVYIAFFLVKDVNRIMSRASRCFKSSFGVVVT